MNIQLHTINLEVADPQRSKRFYVDTLGMRENPHRSHASSFVYLESAGGNLTLAMPPETATAAESSRTMELGFKVDDLAAFRTRLAEQGIAGFAARNMGWADVLEGHDPDGHRVIVYCFKPE